MSGYRDLARNRDFTVLWTGQTVSSLGSTMSSFVYPLLTYAVTGSTAWAAVAESCFMVGRAASLLPAGVLVDRTDLKRLMRAASGAGAVVYASLVAAAAWHHLTLTHLLLAAVVTGVVAGVFMPAEAAAVRRVVDDDDLPTALAQNQARDGVASLVGAPIGGALFAVRRSLPFAVDAVSYAASWIALGRLRTDLSGPPAADGPDGPDGPGGTAHRGLAGVRTDLGEGARFVVAQPLFRTLLVWSALTNVLLNALFFAATLRLIRAGFHPVQIGLVDTVAGAAGLVGALLAPRIVQRYATGRLTVAIAWRCVPLAVPLALWNQPAVMAVVIGLVLLLNPAGNAGIGAYRMAVTPRALLGRTQAFNQFAMVSAMPLAPLLAGLALATLGGRDAILLIGAGIALTALIPSLSRTVRTVPRPDQWPRLDQSAAGAASGATPGAVG